MTRHPALDRIKIGHFERLGYGMPNGVIHVGANDGYEIEWYRQLGIPVIAFEPLKEQAKNLQMSYVNDPWVLIVNQALGHEHATQSIAVSGGDGKGSTFLRAVNPQIAFGEWGCVGWEKCYISRLDSILFSWSKHPRAHVRDAYNCLVVDVQGMELNVLVGCGDLIHEFEYLNIEVSKDRVYDYHQNEPYSGAEAGRIIEWLDDAGFKPVYPDEIPEHDDMLFVKKERMPK